MATAHTFTSKADVAYADLRAQILDGRLPAGSTLEQYRLAEALGISITPLREAIRRLSGEGWVVLDAHRNSRVADLDLDEGRDVLEARRVVEPAAVAMAARRRTDADVAAMTAALEDLLPVTRRSGEPALAAHRAVHEALYRACHNDVLVRVLDDLWDRSDRYRRVGLQLPPGAGPRTRDLEEHHALVSLVVAGEADEAERLMASHVERSLSADVLGDRSPTSAGSTDTQP
ncbi:GntR family transcriptional regulator [Nocardioides aurantiacus]|uniref:GntR family transcriptional regulator n=1 Tax=Nocardioides aurantiacus TaxID=86796 RepID=UPI00403F4F86